MKTIFLFFALLTLLTTGALAVAPEFAGEGCPIQLPAAYRMQTIDTVPLRGAPPQVTKQVLWKDGPKEREDNYLTETAPASVHIYRRDQNVLYEVDFSKRQYVQMPLSGIQTTANLASGTFSNHRWEKIGSDTVNGIACDKYRETFVRSVSANTFPPEVRVHDVDPKTHLTVRTTFTAASDCANRTIDYSFEVQPIDPKLFIVPTNFKKIGF